MATQTVGVCNVLSNMNEVFGRSYQLTQNGGGGASKLSEHCTSLGSAGNKVENGTSVVLANCNRNHAPGGVAATATNTNSNNSNSSNSQQLQNPPSYQSAVTATDNCSPTSTGPVRNTATSNGGQPHLLTEKPPSAVSHNGNKTNFTCDVLL